MMSHIDQYLLYHAQIQADSFMDLKQQTRKNATSLQHLLEQTNFLENRIATVEKVQSSIDRKMVYIEESGYPMESKDKKIIKRLEIQDMNTNVEMVKLGIKVEKLQLEINQFSGNTSLTCDCETTEVQASLSHHLVGPANVDDMANTSSSIVKLFNPVTSSCGGPMIMSKQHVESMQSRLVELESSIDRSFSSCLDHELRIQVLEKASYNGILLWKVDEFQQKTKKAKEGVTASLYSSPFYTERHGYKMCAKVYLNGDGLGKDTHMSFFFVVMRGPVDELLPWPFEQRVSLTLINQMGKKHVTESFFPEASSNSFLKPVRREMNVASGCPMFICLEDLFNGGFLKEDCIYLRVIVDTTNPAQVLPM